MEPNKKSGWYYVGNGQLRFMAADGWTDQYRKIDDPASAVQTGETQHEPALLIDTALIAAAPHRSKPWVIAATATAVTILAVSAVWATGIVTNGPAETQSSVAPTLASAATQTAAPPPQASPTPSTPRAAETDTTAPAAPTRASRPPAPISPPPAPPLPVESEFDQEWALAKADDIIEDITMVDEYLGDGIAVPGGLRLLSDSYGRLADAGVPPGLDRADYLARVKTLQSFAEQAADTYDFDPTNATAQYLVAREETGVLFQQINDAIGSDLALP